MAEDKLLQNNAGGVMPPATAKVNDGEIGPPPTPEERTGLKMGVTFDNLYNTFDDYGLIVLSRPEISPALPKVYTVDNPGGDGVIDVTEATTGYVKYQNRTILIKTFKIIPLEEQLEFISGIAQDLHGKKCSIEFDEDPGFFYWGRVSVRVAARYYNRVYIDFEIQAEPYKMEKQTTAITINIPEDTDLGEFPFNSPVNAPSWATWASCDIPEGDEESDFNPLYGVKIEWGGEISAEARRPHVQIVSEKDGNTRVFGANLTQADCDRHGVTYYIEGLDSYIDVDSVRRIFISGIGARDSVAFYKVMESGAFTIENGAMPVVPQIYSDSSGVTLSFNGVDYNLVRGDNIIEDIVFPGKSSTIMLQCAHDATVIISFTRGWL